MNITKFILTLATFNEKYPSKKQKINKYWQKILKYYKNKGYIIKYDKCDICHTKTLLHEYGLNWICYDTNCEKEMEKWYNNEMNKWQKSKTPTRNI